MTNLRFISLMLILVIGSGSVIYAIEQVGSAPFAFLNSAEPTQINSNQSIENNNTQPDAEPGSESTNVSAVGSNDTSIPTSTHTTLNPTQPNDPNCPESENSQEDKAPPKEQSIVPENNSPSNLRSHKEIIIPSYISFGLNALGVNMSNMVVGLSLYNKIDNPLPLYFLFDSVQASAHIPVYYVNGEYGAMFSAVTALSFSTKIASTFNYNHVFQSLSSYSLLWSGFFSTYATYALGRQQAQEEIYDELPWAVAYLFPVYGWVIDREWEWRPYNVGELLSAPITQLRKPPVAIMAGFSLMSILIAACSSDEETAMWNTGHAYIGNNEVPLGLAIPLGFTISFGVCTLIGVSEESMFRGFLYEDFVARGHPILGKIIDAVGFSALHIPQEIFQGLPPGVILTNFFKRLIMTPYLQMAYDYMGLPGSVAIHAWLDMIFVFVPWLMTSGSEEISTVFGFNLNRATYAKFSIPF